MFRKKTISTLILGLFATFLITGCGSTSKVVKDYTPSSDISDLALDESAKPTLLYIRPGAPTLGEYNSFIIDPVTVEARESGAKKIDSEDEERIKTYFRDKVTEELKDSGYSITSSPGDKTMRISFILSGLKAPSAAPNIPSVIIPIAFSVGGVTVEGTFRESSSDRIDAVAINHSEGARFVNATPWSTWKDVESALDKWAKGIRKSVDKAHGK